jgi:hypothetical protein
MTYKGYEIVAECITERAEYSLNDKGELQEFVANVDCEPEPTCYGVCENGEYIDWCDTIDEVKQYIDKLGV